MKVDSTTWCSPENQAAKYLADVLENIHDDKLPKKVSVYFHRFQNRIKALNGLDKKYKIYYLDLLLKSTENEIKTNFRYELVKTLMLNLIRSIYRQELLKL